MAESIAGDRPAGGARAVPLGEPLAFRMLLDEAARSARRSLKSLYLPVAVPLATVQVGMVIGQVLFMRNLMPLAESLDGTRLLRSTAAYGCSVVLYLVIYLLSHAVLSAGALDAVAGREPRIGRRWLYMLRPGVFGTLLLMWLAIGLGLLLCLLPGILLALLFGFTIVVMVQEGARGTAALSRSGALSRFNPQRRFFASPMAKLFVLTVVGYLLSWAVALLVQLPMTIVQQVLVQREAMSSSTPELVLFTSQWQWLQVPATLFGSLGQTLVLLYLAHGVALLYFDTRRRWEGEDLEAAIDELLGGPDLGLDAGIGGARSPSGSGLPFGDGTAASGPVTDPAAGGGVPEGEAG